MVRATLQKDIALTTNRHEMGAGLFKSLADIAPAMGMIGTLIGLVAMLSNMDDPKAIGPAMAVALLTTVWCLLSQRGCHPNSNQVGIA